VIIRFAASAVLALSLLAAPGQAQTAVELLQKGIYTQETVGNIDAAIQIYRQVASTARQNERAPQDDRTCGFLPASAEHE
jgi:hypothetical protein